jgi:plasmid replication initiation protein
LSGIALKALKTARKSALTLFTGLTMNLTNIGVKMATQQLPLPGEIVKKSNALARARWSAESVWEPRLVALLASKVRADDTDFHDYEIPVAEVMRDRDHGGKDYREIESVVDKVMSRVLTIKDEKGRGWTKYNVFSRCRYKAEKGILELGFHPDLRPHYLNLQKQFAQWNLFEYLMLPSIYSQRIFEILKSWSDRQEVVISVAELHEMLNTPESLRQDFAQFRRRVLEKAHKDILAQTSLRFEWEPMKSGRSVEAIRFMFAPGRKAIAEAEQKKAKAEKAQRAKRNAFLAGMECAKAKNGLCSKADNKKNVCKVCTELAFCDQIRRTGGKPFDLTKAKI